MLSQPQQPDTGGIIRDQSGCQAAVGYVVDVSQPDRRARTTLTIGSAHLNRNGMLHGGIIAMLLDSACGFSASMALGGDALTPVVTVSLTTQFVAGAPAGAEVTALGTVSGGGRKISHVTGELRDGDGRLLATAQGVFKRRPPDGPTHADQA